MITLHEFKNKHFLKLAIDVAFRNDDELTKYHISPSDDFDDMINDTFLTINESSKELDLNWYSVVFTNGEFKDKLIGFVCVSMNNSLIYSFGINKEFRKKDILKQFLRKTEGLFKKDNRNGCSVILYTKNERAVNFFLKNGYNITFNNYKPLDDFPPITGLIKVFKNYIKHIPDLEFEYGLG
jgi:GNAT superfamily N-acetyltransferase